ncbi:MAG: Plug and carboxypeptidase regulatory-like domain-containing protein [Pyrinomonadaceae bacterium]|nr:Plug and carboxypeptidase regulatory-like domain-containing protein [Pyrinomonadaceae bacterium]MCX7638834.1 Plug and carboxypeptidase regulatory-like domain-containing protein [Pyrinomonadaceae bacterium]MDW8305030.1 carboxypeptidase regulatory-like domain-containing protein [Acidobacteriota bacterium]
MKYRLLLLLCTALLAFLIVEVASQGTTSRVTGVVTDTTGAVVPGATVTLTNEATGTSATTQTNASGVYVFDLVLPGTYTVTIERQGFKRFVSKNNQVFVNQPATINASLEAGDVAVTVTVEATAEIVQTSTSGNVGGTVEQRVIESLPIVGVRGRNPLDVLIYQPGFVIGANTGGGVHVHGSRDRAFNFTLDGIDINESTAGGSNFTPIRINPDSIQEFQFVSSNFTAELGRSSGAQVTFVTRSGTNQFRGNIFEYYQTPQLIANEYANNLNGRPKNQFVQHIFGGSLGGPIRKNRMFFFFNLQMLRTSESILVTRTVYTQTARQGIFRYVQGGQNAPAGTTTPSVDANGNPTLPVCGGSVTTNCINTYNIASNPTGVGLDPTLMRFINATPLPNNFFVGDGLNTAGYNFAAPQREKQYDLVFRIDYKFSESNTLYGRYAQGKQDTLCDNVNGGLQPFPDTPCIVNTERDPRNLAINWRWSPSSSITNEFVVGFNYFKFWFGNPSPRDDFPYTFNLITNPYSNFTYNARSGRTIQIIDNLTWVKGNHTVKTGINFRFGRQVDDRSSVAGADITPLVNFSASVNSNFAAFNLPSTGINSNDLARLRSMINDLLGRVGTISQAFVAQPDGSAFAPAGTRWDFRHYYPEYDFYIQDSWKFLPNLTFDIGLRYEIKMSPSSKGRPILRPDGQINYGSAPTNTLRWTEGKLFDDDYDNLAPSVGFAWDPFKSGKTAIRANFRVNYDRFPTFLFGSSIFQSAPGNNIGVFNSSFGQGGGLLRNGLPSLAPTTTPNALRQPPTFGTGSITVVDSDLRYPEVYSWYAGFQREIWDGNVLEVNYIGKRGVHLLGGYDANQVNINARDPRFNTTFLQEFIQIRNNPSYNSPFINALYTGDPNNNSGTATFRSTNSTNITQGAVGAAALSVSQRIVGGQQMIAVNGFSPFLFQKFPQFTGALNVIDSNDLSMYNALEIILKRRIKNGLGYQVSYTLSESKDTRSFDPTFTVVSRGNVQSASSTPFDINNRFANWAWSDFDRRHAWQGYVIYELPFGRGKTFASDIPRVIDYIIGGWQVAAMFNYASGRPFTVYSGVLTYGNVVQSTANCNGCSRSMGRLIQESGTNFWFDAQQRSLFSIPAPGELGNTGRNFFIGPRRFDFDVSLSKRFRITERVSFDLRADMKNFFNVPSFGLPTAIANSTIFGRIRDSVVNNARRIQLSGKLSF